MNIFQRFFGRSRKQSERDRRTDANVDMGLRELRPGALLDYDLHTWEVTAVYHYEWENHFTTKEYKLESGQDVVFLHLEEDDELLCSVARKLSLAALDPQLQAYIEQHDEPYRELTYQGRTYYRKEENLGYLSQEGRSGRSRLVSWDYEDSSEDHFINVERWGETDFEAAAGVYADHYEFSNFLPPSDE